MSSLAKWIRKLFTRRQRLPVPGHASLLDGQSSAVDPLVAARANNIKSGTLASLPDELLLLILKHVTDDVVTLCCLRRVSQVFRRLIYEPRIWIRIQEDPGSDREPFWHSFMSNTQRMKRRLRADGMCHKCKLECDVPVSGLFRNLVQVINLAGKSDERYYRCKFDAYSDPNRLLHCSPCGTHHDHRTFSYASEAPSKRDRQCLGRDGAVQLCDHVSMSWADIENHITEWRERKPGDWETGDWEACLEDFTLECHDISHDRRCGAGELPTWPRARLHTDEYDMSSVVLTLQWEPHSGLDLFTRTAEGQVPASQLRELFWQYRKGPAGILLPSYPSNLVPEMACYNPSNSDCRCLYYGPGDGAAFGAAGSPEQTAFFCKATPLEHEHTYRRSSFGTWNEEVSTRGHWPGDAGPCLITTYERHIPLFTTARDDRVNPSHAWFHAMDPDTHSRRAWEQELPLCRDERCMNYYRRPKAFRCHGGPDPLHHPCICDTPEYQRKQAVEEVLWKNGYR